MEHGKTIYLVLLGIMLFAVSQARDGLLYNLNDTIAPPPPVTAPILDTIPPLKDRIGTFTDKPHNNPFDLRDPKNVEQTIEYDPETGQYELTERLGSDYFRSPTYMTFDEYLDYKAKQQEYEYFQRLAGINSAGGEIGPDIDPIKKFDLSNSLIDRLFGGTTVDLNPKGNIGITLGWDHQNVQNPVLLERQQRNGGLDFDMDIQMNMDGQIGDKLKLNANYNTQSTFDFDRQLKLQYDSEAFSEDEILKKIEAGNVSLPLKSTLIQGNQSLFGLKTDLQFGRLRLTTIISQQNSEKKDLQIEKGAQVQEFFFEVDDYDENRHFFLSHYSRDLFEPGLSNLPQISSLFNITKIEVWITNDRLETENTRDIVALADLGEYDRMTSENSSIRHPPGMVRNPDISGTRALPDNSSNRIYELLIDDQNARDADRAVSTLRGSPYRMVPSQDFEKVRARKLQSSEYTVNNQLGFISIRTGLQPDQILGIAYEYTYNGKKYQVGELSSDFPSETEDASVLFVKMLKSTTQRTDVPAWDLMMKNVYSIGAFQVSSEDFYLDVFYEDPGKGEKRFLPTEDPQASQPLLRLLNLDNLNQLGDPQPDGAFDFVPGVTIFPATGKLMFPVLEPFGSSLAKKFADPNEAQKYIYQQLYDSAIFVAQEYADLNRFTIRARFKSSSTNEYSLGAFNVPQGSVRVTAGGQVLIEGQDYEVDYNLGKVRIINEQYLNSGSQINISYEDNALFSFNRKTMLGFRADYEVSKHLNLGMTYMHLFERPYTQKVNIGEDPINNKIIGLDINYSKKAPWLTRLIDGIPLIDTKAESNITFAAEGAVIKPGHSRAINAENSKSGSLYIDDFEGSSIGIDLRTPSTEWVIASVPQNDELNNNPLFPESNLNDDRLSGVNRARLNWYRIETNIRSASDQGNPFTAAVSQQDIFPNRSPVFGFNNNIQVFDLHYDPTERGPYNFDLPGGTQYSAGINQEGKLEAPETRWAGIMRDLRNTDFQQANIEYIEFWVMNPYAAINDSGDRLGDNGKLYLNLGNISEDILRDSRMSYENGLPTTGSAAPVDPTSWGHIPVVPDINSSFGIDAQDRTEQDVGYDGLDDIGERDFFADYIAQTQGLNLEARQAIEEDPSNDNFQHYRDFPQDVGVFERYSRFNNTQGNSKAASGNTLQSSTNYPDKEDMNNDNTLNESEAYYQYEIPIEYDGLGGLAINEFITDTIRASGSGEIWYRFQIPKERYTSTVGSIQDFRSIRFIRMYITDFEEPVTLRFAKFDLVRNQWRKYSRSLRASGPGEPNNAPSNLEFDIASVNIEENSRKFPFNYVLPPGIIRERAVGTYANIQRNEQSLALNICNLEDGEAAAMFKNLNEDFRNYDSLQMFVHAEAIEDQIIDPGETTLFVRLGSDYTRNYYEYEIPLTMSDPNAADTSFEALDEIVWLRENELNVPLSLLKDKKVERNNSNASILEPWEAEDPANGNKIRIIGSPNLGLVKGVMIGVRNTLDDNLDKCLEVWVNELRLTGLNEKGGVAGLARLDFQLADFGRLSLSGNYSSIGWGALDQKLAERSLEEIVQYDIATNLELGKFFGDRAGLSIPFYAQYSATMANPKFDPYDRDIELKDKLKAAPDATARDSIREQAIDFTSIKSFNFTNVRKERTGNRASKTPLPWDIENFSFTYAQSEIKRHDPIIENDQTDEQYGSIDYNYSTKPLYIQPFKGLAEDSKLIKFITELNFNPIPNSLAVNSALTRQKITKSYRFSEPEFKTWYTKKFIWERNYDLNWDFAKSLKFRFNASNQSVIDELNERDPDWNEDANKELIKEGLRNFGRTKDYTHSLNLSYNVPLQHFPLLDFAQIRAQFTANYGWNAAALNVDSLGNVIQNQQTRQITADLNFEKLYNNIPYLRKINQGKRPTSNRGNTRPTPQTNRGGDADRKKSDRDPGALERLFFRPLMLLRKAKFSYTENLGSVVPGFNPSPEYLGLSRGWDAPGYEFVLGMQPTESWFQRAIESRNNWITDNVFLNQEVLLTKTKKWNAGLTIEPFRDFRLEVNWDYSFTENHSEFFKKASPTSPFEHLSPREVGSFNISYYTLGTLFHDDIEMLFTEFEDNRRVISQRVGEQGTVHANDGAEYTEGFGKYQRDVLVPAFVSSYARLPIQDVSLNIFDLVPKPNWQLTYNGLSKVPLFQDLFSSVSLSHGYRSTLSVNSYNTDFDYIPSDPVLNTNPVTGDYYSRYEFQDVVISEQLSPLIGLNIKTRNDMSLRLDMNKTRNLSLSFTDYQLNESKRTDYTAGLGYTLKNVYIGFLQPKSKKRGRSTRDQKDAQNQDPNAQDPAAGNAQKGNEMEIRIDFSYGDNVSLIHKFDTELDPQASRGSKQIRFSPSVEYALSETLSLRFFLDYNKTVPYTSRSYPITNINSGVTVQFALQ